MVHFHTKMTRVIYNAFKSLREKYFSAMAFKGVKMRFKIVQF